MGLQVSKKTQITNLQYVDDIILFGRYDIKEAIVWKWISNTNELWSGLKINYEKSNVIHLGEGDMNGVFVERILGCNKTCFPIKYLGVLMRDKKFKKED